MARPAFWRTRRARLLLALLGVGVMALFLHASSCGPEHFSSHEGAADPSSSAAANEPSTVVGGVSPIAAARGASASVPQAPAVAGCSTTGVDGGHGPQHCAHAEFEALRSAMLSVSDLGEELFLLGALALATLSVLSGLAPRRARAVAAGARRLVPARGRMVLTAVCVCRT